MMRRYTWLAVARATLSTVLVAAITSLDSAAAQEPLIRFSLSSVEAFSGSNVCVQLSASDNFNPCAELGGFDLLIHYDPSLIAFQGIDLASSILVGLEWEYLTYRVVSPNQALLRIVAIADMNNSNVHPSGWCLEGVLANLCFHTTNDRNFSCQSAHVAFYWNDCSNNTAWSRDGYHHYVIADPRSSSGSGDSSLRRGILSDSCGVEIQLATFEGGPHGPQDFPCPSPGPGKPDPEEALCFINGRIRVLCPGDTEDRVDINLNGLSYEIADAVLFANYLISGPAVFTINPAGQTAASDVNSDGIPLTVADMVYLIRIITGDALPLPTYPDECFPYPGLTTGRLHVTSAQQGANVTVSAHSDADMGAGLFVFDYSGADIADVSALGRASNMNVMWAAENGHLRVLVLPHLNGSHDDRRQMVAAGAGLILGITTTGASVELVSVEAATYMGGVFVSQFDTRVLPTQFELKQNFPNPFNPGTTLSFDVPVSTDFRLDIYNIAGQTVRSFEGPTDPGTVTVTWDGRDARGWPVASGVYFYHVEAGVYRDTKRMLLLR